MRLRSAFVLLAFALVFGLAAPATSDDPSGEPQAKGEAKGQENGEAADAKPKWDVENPPGPTREVAIDVDEGTWLSLDLSPDGKEIVFDLLGDLYTIPATGGEAKALTSGMSWDMQPRYSPDGKWIAFTSDRAGGDNLWVVRRDGSEARQVSKESFRLVNSPAWSPDSRTLAGRKHFTAERSLGSGEIWLWHVGGGDGLQMTDKPNDQKDVGEPAFSPDGRFVYYSLDATPGATFQYDKDPNPGIYAIRRLDRTTGEIEEVAGGPGGAVRPTPSRDGKLLAFVRRVRAVSTLWIQDLASGAERQVFAPLDRDMQETWAIHGVYPTMAWTPDDRAIVLWAGGKIRRLDVATGNSAVIPFHVQSSRRIVEALRFPVEVAPERFRTRMIRWPVVSPKGDRVVFEALGKLWLKALPGGRARRLTAQNERFELYPSWSRDGRALVYTTWEDDKLGSVRVERLDGVEGAQPTVVTREPGIYLEPVFSPDGSQIVYRKVEGDELLGPTWGKRPGIYVAPARGGEARLLTRDGEAPQFGADEDRVYLLRTGEHDKRSLVSLELDGSDLRTHVTSEKATEFAVSPDGGWLAFAEGFQAYLVPFVPTGRSIELGPKQTAVPAARVSRDAGEYLHWSGDSRRLWWSMGPELFERDLKDAFAFLDGAPEKLPEAPAKGIDLGFEVSADRPSGLLALVGAQVVTMRGDEVIADGVVLVEGNRIRAVGPRREVAIPKGAKVIDLAGQTVIPGLVDVHWHGGMGTHQLIPQQSWVDLASLTFGVTTLHDPSNDTHEIFAASELQRAGELVAPRIFSTGTILYGARDAMKAEIDSLEDARAHLRRLQASGAFSVKSYNQPRREQRQQVLAAARELGLMVVPEGGSLVEHNLSMVVDGHTGIEHSLPVGEIYSDVVELWGGAKEVGYTPTLVVSYGGIMGENYWYAHAKVWEHPRLSLFVPRGRLDARSRRPFQAPEEEYNHVAVARGAKKLLDAGVGVQLGAHGQREGLGAHWELWMLAQGGMSPLEALRAGTLAGARYLGMDKEIGSIEPGKLADLAVLERDPLADLRNSDSVRYVVLNGRLYDAARMDEIWPRQRERSRFWFEEAKR